MPAMRILVTGSSGLVGSALLPFLAAGGHEVHRLVRHEPREGEIRWDPAVGRIDAKGLEGFDAVVHLAGESIAGRWTAAKKAAIRESRLKGTRLLAQALAGLARPPKVLIAASAIGIYGDRGDEVLTEDSPEGTGFLAELCHAWEDASSPAQARGIRVVNLRFGVILSPAGGALARMLLPFRLGLGGVVGAGGQWMSWVALDDVLGAVLHALRTEPLLGPVNVASPNPVTNRDFTRALGRVLHRPTVFPLPAFAARLAFGEMADALLLSSARVLPKRLEGSGFRFARPELEGALHPLLDA